MKRTGCPGIIFMKNCYKRIMRASTAKMAYCLLWDQFPFMNFLFIKEEYRSKGFAKQAILSWENKMKNQGYKMTFLRKVLSDKASGLHYNSKNQQNEKGDF